MNRRGDIPITILVIGVFAICGLALLSFFSSSFQIKNHVFVGFEEMEKINLQIEEGGTSLYEEKIDKIFSPEFGFDWFKEKIMFSVKYKLP